MAIAYTFCPSSQALSIQFILTDPPYLVSYLDRSGRSIKNDDNDAWLKPAFSELYRVLAKNSYAISFYGWPHIGRFMDAWKSAGAYTYRRRRPAPGSLQTPYGLIINDNYFNHDYLLSALVFTNHVNLLTDLFVCHLEDQFRIGSDHTFRLVLEYRRKSVNLNDPQNVDIAQNNSELDNNVYTASGTWLWQITDKLSWTNAARIDHSVTYEGGTLDPNSLIQDYNHSLNAISDNSGLVYYATDLDMLRATYGPLPPSNS